MPKNEEPLIKQTFIKIKGEKFAYAAMNVVTGNDFVEFDRLNTKSGIITGHMKINKSEVVSIEERS